MPFDIGRFAKVRPYPFHLTHAKNLESIRDGVLAPANQLQSAGNRSQKRSTPRQKHEEGTWRGRTVWLRDQQPLHAGNIEFEEDWDMPRLLDHIDSHVFFWPGKKGGPIESGLNHFKRYADQRPALLRVLTADLLAANPECEPLFCRFNSGAPRCSQGRKSPRGNGTYLPRGRFEGTAGEVIEIVFAGTVALPKTTEVASGTYDGPWFRLFC